ncbi:hypothetical protein ACOBR2_00865 [Telmatobacter bradus]|uniref:hypothetical protein n=1 Tax=Telmatobacter bradus TaxID=474953 RepID=UPI003B43B4E3
MDARSSLRGMALMTGRFLILSALLVLGLMGAATPGHAADACSSAAQKNLSSLNSTQIVSQVATISHFGKATIKDVQSCLSMRGCYANDPHDVDAIVGPYTTAAIFRLVYGHCATAPVPVDECGDGHEPVTYSLSGVDIKGLEAPPQESDSDQPPDATPDEKEESTDLPEDKASATQASQPAMSPQLMAGLSAMQDIDYPTRKLFENALDFFTTQPLSNPKDYASVAKELDEYKQAILSRACKAHALTGAVSSWIPDWDANMLYSLSDPVYGISPFWLSNPSAQVGSVPNATASAAAKLVDFGNFDRIGWMGVTFSREGALNLATIRQNASVIAKQVETARRFRTSVDLIVYKKLSREQWIDIIYSGSDTFTQNLAGNIANTVGEPLTGFLDRFQRWAMPSLLTSPTTAWDGVTLDLQGYPYDDPRGMQFLLRFLTRLRQDLNQKERLKTVWGAARHRLKLNLIVPYDVFVPAENASLDDATTVTQLAELVPKQRGDSSVSNASSDVPGSIVDEFIVFLPQSTNDTKKQLRLAVESAFNRNQEVLQWIKTDPSFSIAAWRYQMLRRITCVLAPGTWQYLGVYSKPGGQFYDDMLYSFDNFGAVGFWPFSESAGNNTNLSAQIREIFDREGNDFVDTKVAPIFYKLLGARVANFFCGWRRELFLAVEVTLGLFVIYFSGSFWIFELRNFYSKYQWWFALLIAIALAVIVLLCIFDRNLREWALLIFIGLFVAMIAALFARQYFLRTIERDLP